MGKRVQKTGKYFSSIIIKNIGLFLAAGILTILFSEGGWIPDKGITEINILLQTAVIPLLLSYTAGKKAGGDMGKIAGIMAGTGLLKVSGTGSAAGSILLGSLAGYVAAGIYKRLENHTKAGFEMLTRNLFAAGTGVLFLLFSRYVGMPLLAAAGRVLLAPINEIVAHQLMPLANVLIEPGKVFFLNNGINHGLLIPMAMQQAEQTGKSILFLLETNPGPGLGLLWACYLRRPSQRKEISSSGIIHFIGGIHEVYFPYVLSELKLLWAVIAGGAAGTLCFQLTGAGAAGPVSPGSILTVLLMGARDAIGGILLGVFVSALVSGLTAWWLLGAREPERKELPAEAPKAGEKEETMTQKTESEPKKMTPCERIYFVCDAGVGSSALGAAMLRKKLREHNMEWMEVSAVPIDEIPKDAQLLVCQKSFREKVSGMAGNVMVYEVDGLVNSREYDGLVQRLKEQGEG